MQPYYQDKTTILYCGDAIEIIHTQLLGTPYEFPLILTDPPYTSAVHKNAKRGYADGTKTFINFASFDYEQIADAYKKMALLASGWIIATLADDHTYQLKADCQNNKIPLDFVRAGVWVKPNAAPHVNQDRPSQGWESIAFLHQQNTEGKHVWHGKKYNQNSAVFTHGFCNQGLHPTQKPLALFEQLILLCSNAGDIVFDPFAGSGTTLLAAKNTGRRAIGIELDEAHCQTIVKRLSQQRMDI